MARKKKKVPEINASSMADISFLLLIFFLVTTTMDTDSGLTRRLPPLVENLDDDIKVRDRNILKVMVNNRDLLMVNNNKCDVSELMEITKKFITPNPRDEKSPELETKFIDILGKDVVISKGIVSLKNDRGTSYKTYIAVQNELARAYNKRRDEVSLEYFQQKYADLTDKDKIDAINKIVPMRISEAEPEEVKQ